MSFSTGVGNPRRFLIGFPAGLATAVRSKDGWLGFVSWFTGAQGLVPRAHFLLSRTALLSMSKDLVAVGSKIISRRKAVRMRIHPKTCSQDFLKFNSFGNCGYEPVSWLMMYY